MSASTHFHGRRDYLDSRSCRVLNFSLDDDSRSRHGSKFGIIGDGRYRPTSGVGSDGKADTEGRAPAYTRFDWGIDWKGFAEVKRDTAGVPDEEVENGRCEKWEDEGFWDFDADVIPQADSDCRVAPLATVDWAPGWSEFVEVEDAQGNDEEGDRIADTNADEKGICNSGVDSGDDADDERDVKGKRGSDKVKGCLSLSIHLAIERMEEMDVDVRDK